MKEHKNPMVLSEGILWLVSAVGLWCITTETKGASVALKKTIRLSESTSSLSGGGLENLPSEDISGKITATLLKGLESCDWTVWFLQE
ncbi:hypothetical protein RHGRI_007422 [Rhododendron griersonianum]|uniref:Uncharacterized protein n=1 Tax=Rhododendron griersonianum TaxID=479676 RepID=A0AAV6KYB5_9ERIC|nr:hypothetical protein RHGRI_007422 [Rhododendron griersonianum]